MRKNFTPEQMLHTVRQAESGTPVAEVCRKLGSQNNLLQVEAAAGGYGIAELTRLRQLEDENKKLKALETDLTLDKHMLQEVLQKSSKASA
jgi:putative transposase